MEKPPEKVDPEIVKIRQYKLAVKMGQEKREGGGGGKGQAVCDLSNNWIDLAFIEGNKVLMGEIVRLEHIKVLDLSYNLIDDKALELLA